MNRVQITVDQWEGMPAQWGLLWPGMTVIDVGANKGYFSLLAAKRVLPGGRVISYEPAPRNFSDIQVTIDSNSYHHWTVRPCAVSSAPGEAELFLTGVESGSGWGSLRQPKSDQVARVKVPLVTLATEMESLGVEHIDLLKMDIEGHELEALRGALPLLDRQATSAYR